MGVEVAGCEGVGSDAPSEKGGDGGELGVDCGWVTEDRVDGCRCCGKGRGGGWFHQGEEEGGRCLYVAFWSLQRVRSWIRCGPFQGEFRRVFSWLEEKADATDGIVDACEMVGDSLRTEDVVAILPVCKVVVREIRSGEDQCIVNPVQLDMLQAPTFVDAFRYQGFAQSGQIGRVVHADLDSVWEVLD